MRIKFLFCLLILVNECSGQSALTRFKRISWPEKIWVLVHPFKALKAMRITDTTLKITATFKERYELGRWEEDAFRHCLWMSKLTIGIGPRRAWSLGNAHEKGNYLQFRKKSLEEGLIPDRASLEMDCFNNKVGIDLGLAHRASAEPGFIPQKVLYALRSGQLMVIRMDSKGNYLDCDGKIIPSEELTGKWINRKCLIPSGN